MDAVSRPADFLMRPLRGSRVEQSWIPSQWQCDLPPIHQRDREFVLGERHFAYLAGHTVKLSPHPHRPFSLGLMKVNPDESALVS